MKVMLDRHRRVGGCGSASSASTLPPSSIAVLLPLSLSNWRLGLLLIGLSLILLVLTGFVLHKTETLQQSVERYYSDLAERVRHARQCRAGANFTRVEDEVRDLRQVVASMSWRRRAAVFQPYWPERS